MRRIFLLSPAHCGGERAQLLLRREAEFALARQVRGAGAPIGEVFAFLSGLYFRGKLAYARAFAEPGDALVITPNRGLLPVDAIVHKRDLVAFGKTDIADADPRYRRPLDRDARRLAPVDCVLLGSIATAKYVEPLREALGERLLVPAEFAGRGDMSRGGLLLRCARVGHELTYLPVAEAARHGKRPARLPRVRWRDMDAVCAELVAAGAASVLLVDARGRVIARAGETSLDPTGLPSLLAGAAAQDGVIEARLPDDGAAHVALVGRGALLCATFARRASPRARGSARAQVAEAGRTLETLLRAGVG